VTTLLSLLAALVFSTSTACATVVAEWQQARVALLHTPADELFYGVLHPDAALFERAFSLTGARDEHHHYIKALGAAGVQVFTVTGVLLTGTLDEAGHAVAGPDVDALRALAATRLTYDISKAIARYATAKHMSPQEAETVLRREYAALTDCDPAQLPSDQERTTWKFSDQYRRLCVINKLHPHELVKIILTKPTVHLDLSERNTDAVATYVFEQPEMNAYFMRDAMITTAQGVVLGKLNATQRAGEPDIVRFVLQKMGVPIVYEVQEPGRLEGGDYLPAGPVSFIGHGMRTNDHAIRQVLRKDLFGNDTIAVVTDPWLKQEQMHLDTRFNILGNGLAVMVETRYRQPGKTIDPIMRMTVDIWKRHPDVNEGVLEKEGPYSKVRSGADFQDYLEQELHYTILPVSHDDQLAYAINSLAISDRNIFVVKGTSQKYLDDLKKMGVSATEVDFTNLKGGWGATHCTTQILERREAGQ
jgi:arginine deiminase